MSQWNEYFIERDENDRWMREVHERTLENCPDLLATPHQKEQPIYRINTTASTTATSSSLPMILLVVLLVAAAIGLMVFAYLLAEGYRF
jgi:hypothetical protein